MILPSVKALVFDLGGVVLDIDWERSYRAWEKHTTLSIPDIRARFGPDDMYRRHECGDVHPGEYFSHLRELLEYQGPEEDLIGGWNAMLGEEIEETAALIQGLGEAIPAYLFSNSNTTHETVWRARCARTLDRLDDVFVSCSLGHRKPDTAAFEAVAAEIRVAPGAMLFFDDTPENVEGARRAGLQAVHVTGPGDIARALKDIRGGGAAPTVS